MALLDPNQDLDQQTQEAMKGVLMRPGRGKRSSQWVAGGGEFSGLTQNEVYGRLRARQNTDGSGSGPGGGLRTGGLSQESGIDWLHANGPSRYDAVNGINQAQRNVKFTGDASVMSKPDKALFDKAAADKEAKAAADKAAADKAAATTTAPAMPDILNTPVGQTAKPAIPPMIARPAEPAKPVGMAPPGAPNYQAPPVSAAPAPAAPPVLAKPQSTTAAAPAPAPVNPDPLAPAAPNPYPALARPQTAAAPPPTLLDRKRQAIAGFQDFAPKTTEDIAGAEDRLLPKRIPVIPGLAPSLQPGFAENAKREAQRQSLYPKGQAPTPSEPAPSPFGFTTDNRTKKSPLTTPSNPFDPVKVSQNPRTRGISPLGSPTPPVLQKPARPNNQTVVGNIANKRKKNPLSDMLKGLV